MLPLVAEHYGTKKRIDDKWEVVYKRNSKQFSVSQVMQTSQFSAFKAINVLSWITGSSQFSRFFSMTETSLGAEAESLTSSHGSRSSNFNGFATNLSIKSL